MDLGNGLGHLTGVATINAAVNALAKAFAERMDGGEIKGI
jgi:hypothetical protein